MPCRQDDAGLPAADRVSTQDAVVSTKSGIRIRDAVPVDLPLIHYFVRALAEYERLSHEVTATPEMLADALFGEKAKVHALILETEEGTAAGFATWFYTFSTFLGRPGIYIEDIYVEPDCRNRGLARTVFQHLARRVVAEGCGRMEWAVLDWNVPAIGFYRSRRGRHGCLACAAAERGRAGAPRGVIQSSSTAIADQVLIIGAEPADTSAIRFASKWLLPTT